MLLSRALNRVYVCVCTYSTYMHPSIQVLGHGRRWPGYTSPIEDVRLIYNDTVCYVLAPGLVSPEEVTDNSLLRKYRS